MHNLIVALAFIGMIVAPCLIAMRTGASNAEE
jgi:hypothetical protein